MTEQPLDLRASFRAIWRRRLMVGCLAILGLCLGLAYGAVRPKLPSASALVLLPPSTISSAGTPARDMATQIVIASSPRVLGKAGQAVSPPISAAQLKGQVTMKALTDQILQVRVSARDGHDAEVLANAIAGAYASDVAKLPAAASGSGIQIMQPANSFTAPSPVHVLLLGAIGMAAGFVVGALLALIRATRDRRLRGRDEIASAIDVPVLSSMEAKRYATTPQWERLLETYRPSPAVSWGLRRTVSRLSRLGENQDICVLSLAGDQCALAAGPQLAVFAANLGLPTALEPDEDHELAPLRAACLAHQRAGQLANLYTFDAMSPLAGGRHRASGDSNPTADGGRPDLSISVHVVNIEHLELGDFAGAHLILSVSSGFATADDLARLALAAADSDQTIAGIVVVNPDPRDNTTGALRDFSTNNRSRSSMSHLLSPDTQTVEYR